MSKNHLIMQGERVAATVVQGIGSHHKRNRIFFAK